MTDNPFSLSGKNIMISGASSGIGRDCAIRCAAMGARVILLGRNEERLKETLSCMERPADHCYYVVELTDTQATAAIVKEAVEKKGRIGGLLNCAGISAVIPMKVVTEAKMDQFFRNNVYTGYFLTKEVCRMGNFCKEGTSIVFFSSVMGSVGENGKSLYSMTKGALVAGTRSLACELASKKIRVNIVSPGAVVTPINENAPYMADPESRRKLEEMHLLGLGNTEDVANACIYLLSDASKWVTGTNLFVDGGYTAK